MQLPAYFHGQRDAIARECRRRAKACLKSGDFSLLEDNLVPYEAGTIYLDDSPRTGLADIWYLGGLWTAFDTPLSQAPREISVFEDLFRFLVGRPWGLLAATNQHVTHKIPKSSDARALYRRFVDGYLQFHEVIEAVGPHYTIVGVNIEMTYIDLPMTLGFCLARLGMPIEAVKSRTLARISQFAASLES